MKFNAFLRSKVSSWQLDVVFLIVACVAYVFICCLFLGNESSYFDEGFTSYLARFSPMEIAHYTALDVHPPLYYIALHYWQQLVGIDVFSLRFFSVIWGVVAIVFAFLFARRTFGQRAAWSVLLFVVLSPLFIRYSEAMRMYTMALAIVAAATYILVLLHDRTTKHRKLLWIVYAVLVSAGMWTNYFTAFIWLAHLLWIQVGMRKGQSGETKRFVKQWWLAVGGAILLYLPWLPWLIIRFTDVQSSGFWIKPISVDTIVSTLTTATVYKSSTSVIGWLALLACIYIGLVVYVIIRAYRHAPESQRRYLLLLILCMTVPVGGLILLSMPPLQSSYVYRYVINGVFMATILVGISFALVTFSRHNILKKVGLYTLAVVILMSGVVAVKQAGNRSLDTGVKNMVAQAMKRIQADSEPGTPIVSRSPYTYFTASLYETKEHPVYYTFNRSLSKVGSTHVLHDHPEERGIMNLANFAAEYEKIWIIAEDKQSVQTPPATDWKLSQTFTLHDPESGLATSYGAEYVKKS